MNNRKEVCRRYYLKNKEKILSKKRLKNRVLVEEVFDGNLEVIKDMLLNGFREKTKRGYIAIHRNGARFYEHSLVWRLHNGTFDSKLKSIHHINGDPQDNRVENLQLVDKSFHSKIHHRYFHIENEEILLRRKNGQTYRQIADELGCTHGLVIYRLRESRCLRRTPQTL